MFSLDSDKWQQAIIAEHQSIIDAGVWEVHDRQDLLQERKAVNSRWVFTVKLNTDGSIERYKARLVVKGYSQIAGIDYAKTFAPVTRYGSLRLVIALAVNLGLLLEHLDIKIAFLNGDLEEEIWMTPLPGIGLDGKILLLKKSLYGLKQAPLKWYEKLSAVLASLGFKPLHFDPCVYIYFNEGCKTIIVVYVDDLTIVGTRQDLDSLTAGLNAQLNVTVKGPLSWLLGFEVQQSKTGIKLKQQLYIDQLLERFNFSKLNPVKTPLDHNQKLVKALPNEPAIDTNLYQQQLGSLMYLVTCTRPDIAHAISVLSQFCSHPLEVHHAAVKRVFRYLSGTRSVGLVYSHTTGPLSIIGYSDAGYGNCLDTRRSWSGYGFLLGSCLVSWRSTKQHSVATSTTEAEYMALSATARHASWYTIEMQKLAYKVPITLKCDNTSSINLGHNAIISTRSQHIDIHYHYV